MSALFLSWQCLYNMFKISAISKAFCAFDKFCRASRLIGYVTRWAEAQWPRKDDWIAPALILSPLTAQYWPLLHSCLFCFALFQTLQVFVLYFSLYFTKKFHFENILSLFGNLESKVRIMKWVLMNISILIHLTKLQLLQLTDIKFPVSNIFGFLLWDALLYVGLRKDVEEARTPCA